MRKIHRSFGFLILASVFAFHACARETPDEAHVHAGGDGFKISENGAPSSYFGVMKKVMTGKWQGRWTNGTFEVPTEWKPVKVEYRLTSGGSAIIEDYLFGRNDELGMTTVYFKDKDDLRLTHYCGISNHPSMIATQLDSEARFIAFDVTGVTNLASPDSYYSSRMEVEIVNNDHIRIEYDGVNKGAVQSQAYDLRRAK